MLIRRNTNEKDVYIRARVLESYEEAKLETPAGCLDILEEMVSRSSDDFYHNKEYNYIDRVFHNKLEKEEEEEVDRLMNRYSQLLKRVDFKMRNFSVESFSILNSRHPPRRARKRYKSKKNPGEAPYVHEGRTIFRIPNEFKKNFHYDLFSVGELK